METRATTPPTRADTGTVSAATCASSVVSRPAVSSVYPPNVDTAIAAITPRIMNGRRPRPLARALSAPGTAVFGSLMSLLGTAVGNF